MNANASTVAEAEAVAVARADARRKRKAAEVGLELGETRAKLRRLERELADCEEAKRLRKADAGTVLAKVLDVGYEKKQRLRRMMASVGASVTVSWGREGAGKVWWRAGEREVVATRAWVTVVIETTRAKMLGPNASDKVTWTAEVVTADGQPRREFITLDLGGADWIADREPLVTRVLAQYDEDAPSFRRETDELRKAVGLEEGSAPSLLWWLWGRMEFVSFSDVESGAIGKRLWGRWASVDPATHGWDAAAEMVAGKDNVMKFLPQPEKACELVSVIVADGPVTLEE
jgi:hypothetical protein